MKCVVEKEPECSYGYAKDPVSKECIHTEGPQCPRGQKFTGQHCVLWQTVTVWNSSIALIFPARLILPMWRRDWVKSRSQELSKGSNKDYISSSEFIDVRRSLPRLKLTGLGWNLK